MKSVLRIIKILLFIITCAEVLNCCNNDNALIEPGAGMEEFGIYFLKDTTIKIDKLYFTELTSLDLAPIPWISSKDIDFYDWSSHCIYLKKAKGYLFPNYKTPYTIPQSWINRPFVVVANKVPCYLGYFKSDDFVPTSYLSSYPYITSTEINNYPDDVVTSYFYIPALNTGDLRQQNTVKTALNQLGLLRDGIEVSITSDSLKIINGDTAMVRYTINIVNNGKENLYVFDPYKTQEGYYNYYNIGPIFRDYSYNLYRADNRKKQEPQLWDSNWYTLLKAGESLIRTVTLTGYKTFSAGKYFVDMQYSAPTIDISKDIRINASGRYWLGVIRTNLLNIKIDSN